LVDIIDDTCENFNPANAFHFPTRGLRVGARGGISISRVGSRIPRRKGRKGSEGRELESGVRLHINSRWHTGVCQLPRRGSGVGAWQRPAQSGPSSAGLGSWGEFSRPSAPEWYHERHAVAHVSQDSSPLPHCVSFSHSRPLSCSEFSLKKSTPDPRNRKTASGPDPRASGRELKRAVTSSDSVCSRKAGNRQTEFDF